MKFTQLELNNNNKKIQLEFQEAFNNHLEGNFDKAQTLYKSILKYVPDHFDTLRHLGILYQDRHMFEMAEKYYLKAYRANAKHCSIYNNLGSIKFLQFKMDEALEYYKQAFKINPKFVPVINNISAFYHRLLREEECMKFSKLAISLEPNNLNSQINYAKALSISSDSNNSDEAIKIFKKILEAQSNTDNYINLATAYRNAGKLEESYLCFAEALKNDPENASAFFNLSASKLNKTSENVLIDFEKNLKLNKNMPYADKAAIAFGLHNNYNRLKDYNKSGRFLITGNKFMDNWIKPDINNEKNFLNEIENIFSKDYVYKKQLNNNLNQLDHPKPIFILGMPRSGTTLCEQILSSHSKVFGGGELQSFVDVSEIGQTTNINSQQIQEYKNKLKKMTSKILNQKRDEYIQKLTKISSHHDFVTDKLPHNFVLIGFIKILFPQAKIIFCKRNKLDNCFSLFSHKFIDKSHGYSYNQKILGKYYQLHMKLMNHWMNLFKSDIYVLDHEKLINNQENYSREILDYCGLSWEPACLEFYKNRRKVQTASNEQVREPINKKSVSAWKKYDKILEPLKKSLDEKYD